MTDALTVAEKAVDVLKGAADVACLFGQSSSCTHSRDFLHHAESAIRTATGVVEKAAHVAGVAKAELSKINADKKLSAAALQKSASRFSAMRTSVVSDATTVKSTLKATR